jgi:bifunctional DNA-binding transcriptional regulator/antitoxin component of YhaV-PrlF toxin-antitoxin module
MTKTYTVQLEGEDGDILPLPDELCKEMDLKEGDTLSFEIDGESVILRKATPKKVHQDDC